MKILWQTLLFIILAAAVGAGILWGILTFCPPEAEVPEYAAVTPEKIFAGGENVYTFTVLLPVDEKVESCEFIAPESVIFTAPEVEFVRWEFDRNSWRIKGDFRVFQEGTLSGAAVEVKSSGGETFVVKLPELPVVIMPENPDALAVAPPVMPEESSPHRFPWKKIVFAIAVLLAAGIILLWILKKRKRVLPPDEYARKRILELNRLVQFDRISPEEGITGLSDAVKDYLLARFGIQGQTMTSQEFIRNLNDGGLPVEMEDRVFLTGFCNCADMVKFAGKSAGKKEMDKFAFEALDMIVTIEANLKERER